MAVGNYCYVAVCSAARGALAPTEGGEGRWHIVAAGRLQLVSKVFVAYMPKKFAKKVRIHKFEFGISVNRPADDQNSVLTVAVCGALRHLPF